MKFLRAGRSVRLWINLDANTPDYKRPISQTIASVLMRRRSLQLLPRLRRFRSFSVSMNHLHKNNSHSIKTLHILKLGTKFSLRIPNFFCLRIPAIARLIFSCNPGCSSRRFTSGAALCPLVTILLTHFIGGADIGVLVYQTSALVLQTRLPFSSLLTTKQQADPLELLILPTAPVGQRQGFINSYRLIASPKTLA